MLQRADVLSGDSSDADQETVPATAFDRSGISMINRQGSVTADAVFREDRQHTAVRRCRSGTKIRSIGAENSDAFTSVVGLAALGAGGDVCPGSG